MAQSTKLLIYGLNFKSGRVLAQDEVGDRTLFTQWAEELFTTCGQGRTASRAARDIVRGLFFRAGNFPVRLFQIPCSVILNSPVISEQGHSRLANGHSEIG